jgi:hypothetical protein
MKNLFHCHFFHHKSHMDWPEIEPVPTKWETGNYNYLYNGMGEYAE